MFPSKLTTFRCRAGGVAPTGGSSSFARPASYFYTSDWQVANYDFHGCVWTGIDQVASTTTTITPKDFRSIAQGGPYHVSGKVNKSYEAVAMLGFNLSEPIDGTTDQCSYKASRITSEGPTDMSMANIKLTSNGLGIA
jgi:hypothetical protein